MSLASPFSFASETVVTVDETVYAIAAWPTTAARVGVAVVVLLLVALFVLSRRSPRAGVAIGCGLAIGVFFGAFAAFVMYVPHGDARDAVTVFRAAHLADVAAGAVGVGAGMAALLTLALAWSGRLVGGFGAAVVLAAGALVVGAQQHAQTLYAFRDLPFFACTARDDLHVGHARDVAVELRYLAPASGFWIFKQAAGPRPLAMEESALWSPPASVPVRAEKEGRFPVTVDARRGPVRLTSTLWFRGRREEGSPLLPLRVGNRWVYRVVTKQDTGRLLYVNRVGGEESEARLEMEVTGAGEQDGFRTFTVETRGGGGIDVVRRVVALDGQTLLLNQDGIEGGPAIEAADGGPIACTVALLGLSGTCQLGGAEMDELPPPPPAPKPVGRKRAAKPEPRGQPVPIRFALAGPLAFQTSQHSTAGAIGKGFLALVTLGSVILPNGSSTMYALVETRPGPAGAPAVP